MELLATNGDLWTVIGTTIATVVLLLVPGLIFSWYALDRWIDDDQSYGQAIASVEKR